VLVAVERGGPVRAVPVRDDSIASLSPVITRLVDKAAHLMTDQLHSYKRIGKRYASHESVNHARHEYARGNVHNNTAESFGAILERTKQGVFHYISQKHMSRYLEELGFRWDHRTPELKLTRKAKLKIIMVAMPIMDMFKSVISHAAGRQLRRSASGGIRTVGVDDFNLTPLFGL
jgi:hypothetical protein